MPKKTKRQKILANLHRKLQYATNPQLQNIKFNPSYVKSQNDTAGQNKLPEYAVSFDIAKENIIKAKNPKTGFSYAFVKSDLIKITIFTAFALTAQGVLYFLLRTR